MANRLLVSGDEVWLNILDKYVKFTPADAFCVVRSSAGTVLS